jgi:hypothetical protein
MSEVRQFGAVIWSFIGWLEALEGERTYVSWLDCDLGGVCDAIGIDTFLLDISMGASRAVRAKLEMSRRGWKCIVAVAMGGVARV